MTAPDVTAAARARVGSCCCAGGGTGGGAGGGRTLRLRRLRRSLDAVRRAMLLSRVSDVITEDDLPVGWTHGGSAEEDLPGRMRPPAILGAGAGRVRLLRRSLPVGGVGSRGLGLLAATGGVGVILSWARRRPHRPVHTPPPRSPPPRAPLLGGWRPRR